jgi:hypothetical protein
MTLLIIASSFVFCALLAEDRVQVNATKANDIKNSLMRPPLVTVTADYHHTIEFWGKSLPFEWRSGIRAGSEAGSQRKLARHL